MRYFFISDVHGEYDKMIEALNNAGFDMEKDTLVNIGDAFDRGTKSKEVLHYFLQCPHHILIAGNHDLRLEELVFRKDFIQSYDYYNGVPATIVSFCGWQTEIGHDVIDGLAQMKDDLELKQYWRELCFAVEFPDLIAVHAWLPVKQVFKDCISTFELCENWRDIQDRKIWYDASWGNTEKLCSRHLFPEKKLIVGHFHAWRLAEHYMEKRYTDRHLAHPQIDCSTFEYRDKVIFIDGMSNYEKGGKVNVYIYESAETPIIYR